MVFIMNRCKKCGISVADESNVCPLCGMVLTNDGEPCENSYPDIVQKTRFFKRIINIATYFLVVLAIVLVVINYYTYFGVKWSLISGSVILYLIITLQYTFNKRNGHIWKIFVQVVGALFLEIAIDYALGFSGWSLNIGIPCIIFAVDAIILICMIVNNKNWPSYLLMQLFTVMLSVVHLILYLFGVVSGPALPWIAFGVSSIMFTSCIVIGGRRAENELKRRFYI